MSPVYPEDLILLEPVNVPAEEILSYARNPAAVYRYIDCLERGWIGQALRERYTYGESENTPPGLIETNSIKPDGTFIEWLKPIEDQIKDDLRESIDGNDELISVTRETFTKGLENTDDPGLALLKELVDMMDAGLENMPKVLVTILDLQGAVLKPAFAISWHNGLEDAVSQLSAKILDEAVLGMTLEKVGRDMHVSYKIDDRKNNEAAIALVKELMD